MKWTIVHLPLPGCATVYFEIETRLKQIEGKRCRNTKMLLAIKPGEII